MEIEYIETDRLLLRPLQESDVDGMFALDSNPKVHQYIGNKPQTEISQSRDVIAFVQKQYKEYGIGRWAVIEKASNEFVGWSGLKVEHNVNGRGSFYDIGYRLREEFWGKGYATEAAEAFLNYGFKVLKAERINAYTDSDNKASQTILTKCGLVRIEVFTHQGKDWYWFEITKKEFDSLGNTRLEFAK